MSPQKTRTTQLWLFSTRRGLPYKFMRGEQLQISLNSTTKRKRVMFEDIKEMLFDVRSYMYIHVTT